MESLFEIDFYDLNKSIAYKRVLKAICLHKKNYSKYSLLLTIECIQDVNACMRNILNSLIKLTLILAKI